MAFNAGRAVHSVEKEVLAFATGLEAIDSVIIAAENVEALPSAVTGVTGKLGLRAGTILQKIDGDPQNRYEPYDGSGDIAGILGDNKFFYDNTEKSDAQADVLFHNCVFNQNKIIDFDTYETELKAALHTCRFYDKTN